MYEKVFNVDMKLCSLINRACHYNFINMFFAIISRLGNGVFWYVLMFALPFIYGVDAINVVFQMLTSSLIGLLIYNFIKINTERLRPYMASDTIKMGTQPLDQFSFPSGHTLHAVNFSIILCFYYPEFTFFLFIFSMLIAASRVILGLHYPSDVLAGAFIGMTTSAFILFIFS